MALCLQKLEESQMGVTLPRNIYQGVFITLAWNNIDHSEEKTNGEGTSHRVNGMALQPRIIGPMPQLWATCQQSTSPSTEMSTVNEDPTQTLNIMKTLGLKESVCVFDQVFYVKTAEITWKHDQFKSIIFSMVAFHTIPFETSYIDHREEVSGCWLASPTCVWGLL